MTTVKATRKSHKSAYLMSKNNDYMRTARLARDIFSSLRQLKQRRQRQRKRHIKIELCVRLSALRLLHVVHVYKIDEVCFHLIGTNGFHVKAENERFTAAGSCCRQKLKYENSRRHLADYVKKLHQKACHKCSTIIFPYAANQIIDLTIPQVLQRT